VNQRSVQYPALNETHDLLSNVLQPENLKRAWRQVRANKGAAGVDNVTVENFPLINRKQWQNFQLQIEIGNYQPLPVKRVYLEKDDGSQRKIGIPIVRDRVIQQASVQILSPLFEKHFSDHSFGFRPKRSCHQAIKRVQMYIKAGYKVAVDVDLSKFFDKINHDVLMHLIGKRIHDKLLKRLIGQFLRAGVKENGQFSPSTLGAPQGGPLSPLLSNIVLDVLDKELEKRGHKFVRYCDDFIILVKSERAGHRVLASITRFLEKRLKLAVNEKKSKVVSVNQCQFLGFSFNRNNIIIHPKSLEKFKHKVKCLTGRSWGVSMSFRLQKLKLYLQGWMNYFCLGIRYQKACDLDQWIRRRIRMCFWKCWRKPRTKIRKLIKGGVSEDLAIRCGVSSKSYWRNSKTKGIQIALNDNWLKLQGLFSLRESWISFTHQS
jgi:RNA-directed DNA polymerase